MSRTLIGYSAAALLCIGLSNALADDRVGNPLSRQISEAIALAKVCPDLRADDQRISELVQQARLDQASIERSIEETTSAILDGSPAAERQSASCSLALARYGPKGSQLAGLVLPTVATPASSDAEVPTRKVKVTTIIVPKAAQ
jgi:hypothetical protein